jgi:hypothetical protein
VCRSTGRPGLGGCLEIVDGEVPTTPDADVVFYNCAALVWNRVDGGSIVTSRSAVVFHRNATYTTRGTISHMSPEMVGYLARAYLLSINASPLPGKTLPSEFCSDPPCTDPTPYNLKRRVQSILVQKGTDCCCKFHTGSAPIHPQSTLMFGCAMCVSCASAVIHEPDINWLSLDTISDTYDPGFVETIIIPLFETRMKYILLGAISRQSASDTNVASCAQYIHDGTRWSALSMCRHWKSGPINTHILELSDPMTVLYYANRSMSRQSSHIKQIVDDPKMIYHGWITQHCTPTASTLIGRLSLDFYTDDPHRTLLLTIRIPDLDMSVILTSAMYRCWRMLLSKETPSVQCCATDPGYTIDLPHVIDAGSETEASIATGMVVVVNAEHLTWELFESALAQQLPILLHGNLDASGIGTGVFISLFMLGMWSDPPFPRITSYPGGVEHCDSKWFKDEIAFIIGDTPNLAHLRPSPVWTIEHTWMSLLPHMIPMLGCR